MSTDGVLEVHDNVVFDANAAETYGGAVSLPYETVLLLLPVVVLCNRSGEGWFDLLSAVDQAPLEGFIVELQSRVLLFFDALTPDLRFICTLMGS